MSEFDNPGRLLADLRKTISLHSAFGIEAYPLTPAVKNFFKNTEQFTDKGKRLKTAIKTPVNRMSRVGGAGAGAQKTGPENGGWHQIGCADCAKHQDRDPMLYGRGNSGADLLIIVEGTEFRTGAPEAPDKNHNLDLLTRMLLAINLDLEQVYITDIAECRAPKEKQPAAGIKPCSPFLVAQIDMVRPEVICAMGPLAVQTVLRSRQPLARLRGRWQQFNGIDLMPTLHPSYLLKNPEMKKAAWHDLQLIQARLQT